MIRIRGPLDTFRTLFRPEMLWDEESHSPKVEAEEGRARESNRRAPNPCAPWSGLVDGLGVA